MKLRLFLTKNKRKPALPGSDLVQVAATDLINEVVQREIGYVTRATGVPVTDLELHFDDGEYLTAPMQFQSGQLGYHIQSLVIRGNSGQKPARLWLHDNGSWSNNPEAAVHILTNKRRLDRVEVRNIRLNCDWYQHEPEAKRRMDNAWSTKLGGLYFRASFAIVKGVEVSDFGSATGMGQKWAEVFPLFLQGLPVIGDKVFTERLQVQDCRVRNFDGLNGGYCTAIMLSTIDPYTPLSLQKDLSEVEMGQPYGRVEYCKVENIRGGIGLGCANGQQLSFTDNVVHGCYAPFNCDAAHTVANHKIFIGYNEFLGCQKGIHFGSPGYKRGGFANGVHITDNRMQLLSPLEPALVHQGGVEDLVWSSSNTTEYLKTVV